MKERERLGGGGGGGGGGEEGRKNIHLFFVDYPFHPHCSSFTVQLTNS